MVPAKDGMQFITAVTFALEDHHQLTLKEETLIIYKEKGVMLV